MAVRRVVTRSGRGVRGYFPSRKTQRLIPWESLLEMNAILHFEYSPGVRWYEGQPERIEFWYDGRISTYVPDFALELIDSSELRIEVKPESKLLCPGVSNRLAAIADRYASAHNHFRILTERHVRHEHRLTNLRLFAYHAGRTADLDVRNLRDRLLPLLPMTVADAVAMCGDITSVYRLLADGELCCDINQPVTAITVIDQPHGENHHATLFF